ncbi:hypothetical protein [Cerasicoccus frondis]|uniref:hypothetical protein n=1 Tax=Cerasicoccus frondis TaxID=490090 RepID=UPI0028527F33|nr:hypothetical protein [Cerasicoccus frondis]
MKKLIIIVSTAMGLFAASIHADSTIESCPAEQASTLDSTLDNWTEPQLGVDYLIVENLDSFEVQYNTGINGLDSEAKDFVSRPIGVPDRESINRTVATYASEFGENWRCWPKAAYIEVASMIYVYLHHPNGVEHHAMR